MVVADGPEDQWGLQSHKYRLWKFCVLQAGLHISIPTIPEAAQHMSGWTDFYYIKNKVESLDANYVTTVLFSNHISLRP
jgi:hypothetical protein